MSDMDGYVTGLQGRKISNTAPNDGYVLTWDNGDSEWQPKEVPASGGLRKEYFTADDTWTCPAGVTTILIYAAGGGQGGGGGSGGGNAGGGAAHEASTQLSVTPNTTYTIIIGVGGTGGVGGSISQPNNWTYPTYTNAGHVSNGTPTYFKQSSTNLFLASGPWGNLPYNIYSNGTNGSTSTYYATGGQGGGFGPQGSGGNGGNATDSVGGSMAVAGNGQNAPDNSGAGGGGGGGCGNNGTPYNCTGGNGGNGGSGYLYIIY